MSVNTNPDEVSDEEPDDVLEELVDEDYKPKRRKPPAGGVLLLPFSGTVTPKRVTKPQMDTDNTPDSDKSPPSENPGVSSVLKSTSKEESDNNIESPTSDKPALKSVSNTNLDQS
jgi:hypothetical protein